MKTNRLVINNQLMFTTLLHRTLFTDVSIWWLQDSAAAYGQRVTRPVYCQAPIPQFYFPQLEWPFEHELWYNWSNLTVITWPDCVISKVLMAQNVNFQVAFTYPLLILLLPHYCQSAKLGLSYMMGEGPKYSSRLSSQSFSVQYGHHLLKAILYTYCQNLNEFPFIFSDDLYVCIGISIRNVSLSFS